MNHQPYSIIFKTPVEILGVRLEGDAISAISWLPGEKQVRSRNPMANKIKSDILNYLENGRPLPDAKMNLNGTSFQLKVWRALQMIKMGNVNTYGQLAKTLKTSSRAVGKACRINPVVLYVPCHRVISTTGIGGYMGKQNYINIKEWLLEHEKIYA
jgi:methylated-DNA-[protein]-cysteine S-methyltransferase